MPRVVCPKCEKAETIQKSGIVRKKQRFYSTQIPVSEGNPSNLL